MGNSESQYQEVQRPMTDVVATEQRFVFNQKLTLLMNEHILSFSGDDFSIKDINGQEYFKCSGKVLSIRDQKVLYDLYKKPILNIRHKILSLVKNIKIYEGKEDNKLLAKARQKHVFSLKKLTLDFYNKATEKDEILEIKSDLLFGFCCRIYHGAQKQGAPMIAKITKRVDMKLMFTDKENYVMEIAPGVDAALIVALAIIFDEFKNEDHDH